MAYINYSEITSNSIEIVITELEEVNYKRIFYFYINETYKGSRTSLAGSSADISYIFKQLSSETTYNIKVNVVKVIDNSESWVATLEDVATTEKNIIEPWTWENCQIINGDAGEASDVETIGAYSTLINKKPTQNFSYKVWNDLCLKTQEVRMAMGASDWKTEQNGYKFTTFYQTLMSEDDRTLTATRFNGLRINIGSMVSLTNIPFPVKTGDFVFGNYLLELAEGLNKVISTL